MSKIESKDTTGKAMTMNEDLPKVINVTIPFNLGVKINEDGSKSSPIYMRHAEYIGKAGEKGKQFEEVTV